MILLIKRADELQGGDKLVKPHTSLTSDLLEVEDVLRTGYAVIVDVGRIEPIELQCHQLVGVWG